MNRTMLIALAITLGVSANVALAEGNPELNRPFDTSRAFRAPPSVAISGPVVSDADANARLRADGYRGISLMRGSDGAWYGTAIRGSARLNVQVTPDGRVLAR